MIDTLAEVAVDPVTWLWLVAAGMAAGTVGFFVTTITIRSQNRRYYVLLALISGIAAVAYVAMALGIGWLPVDKRTVFLPRYIDWLLTTPLLLVFLALLARLKRRGLVIVLTANTLMLGFGLGAAVLETNLRYVLFGAGVLSFLPVVYYLFGPMTSRARTAEAEQLFLALRNLTVALWVIYPLAWLVGPMGAAVTSLTVDIIVIGYLDLVSKVGFGLIALLNADLIDAVGVTEGDSTAPEIATPAE